MSGEKVGKIGNQEFAAFIASRLGSPDPRIIVPPQNGIDAGVIRLPGGKVLVIAEDPIFSIPGQPPEMFGWYTVHIGASDIAVMGVRPQFMTYTLLMPPGTPHETFHVIVDSIHQAARVLGIAIAGGHTGFYPGLAAPTIGGVTVFSVADEGTYVTPAGAREGDSIILTKGPAIETAGILAVLREKDLLTRHPRDLVERAKSLCSQMSVVKDALVAHSCGGVTAMHDATEGGVIGGLFEIADASGVGMEIDESRMIYPEEVRMICEDIGIDPLEGIAEGSLLITADPAAGNRIIQALEIEGIPASVIGIVTGDMNRRLILRKDGTRRPLEIPEQDPFWPVFFESVR